jgi:hypothetical protein
VHACDQIQYHLRSGPCVDAVVTQPVFNAADLRTDRRWPRFGRRAVGKTGIVSMLSIRLFVESDADVIAGLNLYARKVAAFDRNSEAIAQLLATHGASAVGKAAAHARARNLNRALQSNREIAMATGILMAIHRVTADEAFGLLRLASQYTNGRLADIAAGVAQTGALPGASCKAGI